MLTITKSFEFCASHRLFNPDWSDEKNFEIYNKCSNPSYHGHNFKLEVSISGEVSPDTGMIINLSELDKIVKKEIVDELDHKNLNKDVPWIDTKIVSLENLIQIIWDKINQSLAKEAPKVRLEQILLWETSKIFAKITRD